MCAWHVRCAYMQSHLLGFVARATRGHLADRERKQLVVELGVAQRAENGCEPLKNRGGWYGRTVTMRVSWLGHSNEGAHGGKAFGGCAAKGEGGDEAMVGGR